MLLSSLDDIKIINSLNSKFFLLIFIRKNFINNILKKNLYSIKNLKKTIEYLLLIKVFLVRGDNKKITTFVVIYIFLIKIYPNLPEVEAITKAPKVRMFPIVK